MQRTVSAHLELTAHDAVRLVLAVAVAPDDGYDALDETLAVTADGRPLAARRLRTPEGVVDLVDVPAAGPVTVDYSASIAGRAGSAPGDEAGRLAFLRPSRYCQSDTLGAVAAAEFAGLAGRDLLDAVSSWVGQKLAYVSGSSRPTDGAVHTLLSRQGVCRDFAHLVVALLRSLGVPARLAAVYAPGLDPMDFHAVAEAWVDHGWQVVDATLLAPRPALVRIATGRDAADTAFLTNYGGGVDLQESTVTATVDPELPDDDPRELVQLR